MTYHSPIIAETTDDIGFSKIVPALVGAAIAVVVIMPIGWFLGGTSSVMGIVMGGAVSLINLALIGLVATWSVSFAKGNIATVAVGVSFLKLPILLFSVWFVATHYDVFGVVVSIMASLLGASIAVHKNTRSLKTA
jgi:hypothetical protein